MDTDNETKLVIWGDPVSKGRPRFSRYGKAYTPPRTASAEEVIRVTARGAGVPLRDHPVAVELVFYTATRRRTDLTNLAKLPEDALNGIAWTDDYLVESLEARVYRAIPNERPRTEITIRTLS